MSFLTADWRKLIMVNYDIDPKILQKYVPVGTELDFYEDKCYVSLVGFMFLNTRLLGVNIPFHKNFEEVNLRFYVKRKIDNEIKRGVVFIKEIVPKPALTFIANTVYKENYVTLPMSHKWRIDKDKINIEYSWTLKGYKNLIQVISNKREVEIKENSKVEFIAEHYWGYSKNKKKETTEYEVRHVKWKYYSVIKSNISVDFETNYGFDFMHLKNKKPDSVMLLEGSTVSVENKKTIKC